MYKIMLILHVQKGCDTWVYCTNVFTTRVFILWLLNISVDQVSLPFLVVHGGDDQVTDPSTSKLLYESACSTNKTFKLYEGMWHSLTYGELPENTDVVYSDIVAWLDDRVTMRSSMLENEKKLENDNLLRAESSEESTIES